MKRFASGFGAMGVLVLTASAVLAQAPEGRGRGRAGGGAPLPAPKNLQVMPKDTPPADLLATMQGFNVALGVQCGFCHAPAPPPPPGATPAAPAAGAGRGGGRGAGAPPPLDFASDDKAEKKAARLMIRMVSDLNAKLTAEVAPVLAKSGAEVTKVQCATCHRGVAQPEQLSNLLSNLMLTKGESVAAAKYKELRTTYYGAQAYDFTEPVLVRLAQASMAANKLDDALAWAKLNLEFYPRSSQTYVQMSQIYTRKADQAQAIKALEKAVELDPENANAKRQLDELKGPAPAAATPAAAPAAK